MNFSDLLNKARSFLPLLSEMGQNIIDFCFYELSLGEPFNANITVIEILFGSFLISYLAIKLTLSIFQ